MAAAALAGLAACAPTLDERATRAYAELTSVARGLGAMRTERTPADAPFDARDLARSFERIVFFSEFSLRDGALVPEENETRLIKWTGPIRWRLVGDAASDEDARVYFDFGRRLADLTGLEIRPAAPGEPDNLLILILSREARMEAADILEAAGSGGGGLVYRLRTDDYAIPCAASIGAEADGSVSQAVILVKGETSGLLRLSCAHEEFAQALGPGNDFGGARPSIFNDDGEFALLTEHDELILRALYDARIESGMSRTEAMPLVRRIFEELLSEGNAP